MTRVSENSATRSLNTNVNRIKKNLEDLHLKGSTLKRMRMPSDDPMANIETLTISSRIKDINQYLRNASNALMFLNSTEDSIGQLTELLTKAKELAIQHSSDFYDGDIRKNVANEVDQLRNHSLSIANKRIGNRYIFSGYSTLTTPFDQHGKYFGDNGHITTEVSKDFFVPINLTGQEVFFYSDDANSRQVDPLDEFPIFENSRNKILKETNPQLLKKNQEFINGGRDLAHNSSEKMENEDSTENFKLTENIFALLSMFTSALENNQPKAIQTLLERFDLAVNRLITLRTRIGSIARNVENSKAALELDIINGQSRKTELVDADITELFSDITKQNDVLKTAYQASNAMLKQSLLDFIK